MIKLCIMSTSTLLISSGIGVLLGLSPFAASWVRTWIVDCTSTADERYGHPLPVIATLRSSLPEAPVGYAWEVFVRHGENGAPFLNLRIIDSTTAQPVACTSKDLVHDEYWPWARTYRKYTVNAGHARKRFRRDFLGPLVDWANGEIWCLNRPDDLDVHPNAGTPKS
ncbi:hypothetical protein [Mycobacteroides abscessus]|uniref:hypothetical protein n=1 Tax=Mycobacteroides abscessus TaxID=36809 RepID=UPI001F5FDA8C|nr:hypothetical protein [Mycobacteroides abscessus]